MIEQGSISPAVFTGMRFRSAEIGKALCGMRRNTTLFGYKSNHNRPGNGVRIKIMKKILVKTICSGKGLPVTTLAHPGSKPGDYNGSSLQIREITDIPQGTSPAFIVSLWRDTIDLTPFGDKPRLSFRFDEIGPGKIAR